MVRRIGILGGTFNPIHRGHMAMAEIAMKEFDLDQMILIPSYLPPHKEESGDYERRLEMCRLAVGERENYVVSEIERELGGVSFTYRTLEELKEQNLSSELYYIIGGDTLMNLDQWRSPERIAQKACMICIPRPGTDKEAYDERIRHYEKKYDLKIYLASESGPDISSTEIRRRLESGEDVSDLLPREVVHHVAK